VIAWGGNFGHCGSRARFLVERGAGELKTKGYLYTGVVVGVLAGMAAAAYSQETPDAAGEAQRVHQALPAMLMPAQTQGPAAPATPAQAPKLPVIAIPQTVPGGATGASAQATGTVQTAGPVMQAADAAKRATAATSVDAPAIEVPSSALSASARTLMEFKASDAKFKVDDLMDILRDKRHEGWVLAAYPDPKTAQPLIGAGFSLDLPEREHVQRDPLNPHLFLEPSSADLWLAAGLDPAKLQRILEEFYARRDEWSRRTFRRQIYKLDPQITDDEADALLRIGIVQSIDNAKAYCRNFDRLSASQQMAMTQLVYQMGVNLEEFSSFLTLLNQDNGNGADTAALANADAEYWRNVQLSLVHSQWARLYRARATAVIAMLDPQYGDDPAGAEHSIGVILHPARRHASHATVRTAGYTRHRAAAKKRAARARKE